MFQGLVIPLIYMRENVPLKQNESVKKIFTPVFQEKRKIFLKQDKVLMLVLLHASSQSEFPSHISAQFCHYVETRPLIGSSN